MFNYNNVKYRYMVDSIEAIRSNHAKLEELKLYGLSYLEHNVIAIGGGRQTGKTLSMKKYFRADRDIFITPRDVLCDYFMKPTYNINTGYLLKEFTKEELKLIKDRKAVFSITSDLEKNIKNALTDDSVIYLDVFSVEIPDNHIHVKRVTDFLNKLFKNNIISSKIILIHT